MLFPPPIPRSIRLIGLVSILPLLVMVGTPSEPQSAAWAAGTTLTPTAAPTGWPQWEWPIDGARSLVRPYLAPATEYAAGHRGIDIAAPEGAPVLAPADGTVHFAGVIVDRPVLSIRHHGGLISSFEPVSTELVAGDSIRRGERVGTLEQGHCVSPCLHFGVRQWGEYVSPLNLLGGIPHSVLLPTRPLR